MCSATDDQAAASPSIDGRGGLHGHLREGRERLRKLLALTAASAPTLERAKALDGAGVLALYQHDHLSARALFKESLALFRQHAQRPRVAWTLIHLGWLCHDAFRFKAARRFLRESLTVCRRVDDRRGIARSLILLGNIARFEANLITARSLHEESLALNREIGDRWGTARALHNLGYDLLVQAELGQSDAASAHPLLQESLETWRELGERRFLAFASADLGVSAIWQGDLHLARVLLDESLSRFVELDDFGGVSWTLFNCGLLFATQDQHERAVRVLGASSTLTMAAQGRPIPPLGRFVTEQLSMAIEKSPVVAE